MSCEIFLLECRIKDNFEWRLGIKLCIDLLVLSAGCSTSTEMLAHIMLRISCKRHVPAMSRETML